MSLSNDQLEQLDPFSRDVALRVLKRFEPGDENAWLEIEEGDEEPFLIVQWPAPHDDGCDFELSTFAGEITLSTRFWHAHSSLLAEDENEEDAEAMIAPALDLLARLLAGEVRPFAVFRNGEWLRSGEVANDAELELLKRELGPMDWLRVRSYDGKGSLETGPGPKPDDL